MELYWNKEHSEYAVLISSSFCAGWSTINKKYPEIAFDKRVIEWYLAHSSDEYCREVRINEKGNREIREFFDSLGYKNIWFYGYEPNMLVWVPANKTWRIGAYNGSEFIEYLDMAEWRTFPNNEVS